MSTVALRAALLSGGLLLISAGMVEAREPSSRLYVLAEGAHVRGGSIASGDVTAMPDGGLLIASHWPDLSVFRLAVDGSRAPVELAVPGADESFFPDELLLMPDGSTIVDDFGVIWRVRTDGTSARVAGTADSCGFSGDGGPATSAQLCSPTGLALARDGSVLFADGDRVRRISPGGIISTVGGSGEGGFSGDGGPATLARMAAPADVLPLPDGGFLIADMGNGRVRRVRADGRIVTIAGSRRSAFGRGTGDGGPATAARLESPSDLARFPGGALAIAEPRRVRRVDADGIITSLVNLEHPVSKTRLGDFAGRHALSIDAMAVTQEGGLALSAASPTRAFGFQQVVHYLAPRTTARTLVAVRDAHVSKNRVKVEFDATQAGTALLEVRRRGRIVAQRTRNIRAGRSRLNAAGRLGAATHHATVTVTGPAGQSARDSVTLYTGALLRRRHLHLRDVFGHEGPPHCQRMSTRRIDCEIWQSDYQEPLSCAATLAFRLTPAGVLFDRVYSDRISAHVRFPCAPNTGGRFRRHPRWAGPWQTVQPG